MYFGDDLGGGDVVGIVAACDADVAMAFPLGGATTIAVALAVAVTTVAVVGVGCGTTAVASGTVSAAVGEVAAATMVVVVAQGAVVSPLLFWPCSLLFGMVMVSLLLREQ